MVIISSALRRIAAVLLLVACAALTQPAFAQGMGRKHIAAELIAPEAVTPGETTELAVLMTPEAGWHGYWSNPGDAGLGMSFDWSLPTGWQTGEVEYPVPHTLLISGLMNHVYEGPYALLIPVSVPQNAPEGSAIPITVKAEWLACTDKICVPEEGLLATTVRVGTQPVENARFDAWRAALPPLIDQKASFERTDTGLRIAIPLPQSLDIAAPHLFLETQEVIDYAAPQTFRRVGDQLVVELAQSKAGKATPEALSGILKLDDAGNGLRFEAAPGDVPTGGTLLQSATAGVSQPYWMLILLALAGGLLLNIMPCVFPILSLKAMSLARAGESEAEARREGLAYTAGVVLACLALGALMLALRAGGEQIGWAFQLQEPGVVVALLALALAITANFAGLYELPSFSITGSGQPLGAFATGLLAAFAATPCTGPFMAVAMGAALLLPPLPALLLFGALGLGLALPFLLLGFVPPLRKMLPRPGKWMVTFRHVLAIPMGLTALALLWLVWRLGGLHFAMAAMMLAIGLTALLVARHRMGKGFAIGAAVVSAVAVVGLMQGYVPQAVRQDGGVLKAEAFSRGALAEARASGQPVFLWFTADWCLTCKVNEGVAIEREATKDAFEQAGVIALRGDWTLRDPEITRFLMEQGAAGVPLYLWYPAGGEVQQLPQVLTPDSLVELAQRR